MQYLQFHCLGTLLSIHPQMLLKIKVVHKNLSQGCNKARRFERTSKVKLNLMKNLRLHNVSIHRIFYQNFVIIECTRMNLDEISQL